MKSIKWTMSGAAILSTTLIVALLVEHGFSAADDARIIPTTSATSAAATKVPSDKLAKTSKNVRPGQMGFTAEREAAALTFVRQHHPELADLLTRLKDRRPQEYQKAIRDLFRVSERLALSNEQQPARYELELQEWKLASRIQLLAARMSMNGSPELEQELRGLLADQLEVHRQLVKFNYDRAATRAAALAAELEDIEARKAALVNERYQEAMKAVGAKKQSARPSGPGKSAGGVKPAK